MTKESSGFIKKCATLGGKLGAYWYMRDNYRHKIGHSDFAYFTGLADTKGSTYYNTISSIPNVVVLCPCIFGTLWKIEFSTKSLADGLQIGFGSNMTCRFKQFDSISDSTYQEWYYTKCSLFPLKQISYETKSTGSSITTYYVNLGTADNNIVRIISNKCGTGASSKEVFNPFQRED